MERTTHDKLTAKAKKLYNETAIVESVTDPAKVKGYVLSLIAAGRLFRATWIGNSEVTARETLDNLPVTLKLLCIARV